MSTISLLDALLNVQVRAAAIRRREEHIRRHALCGVSDVRPFLLEELEEVNYLF